VNNNYSPVIFLNLLSWEFFTGNKKVKSNPSIKNILVRTVKRMSQEKKIIAPEHTSVRVALWRVLHVQIDSKPQLSIDKLSPYGRIREGNRWNSNGKSHK
jgi:hypothetical protein